MDPRRLSIPELQECLSLRRSMGLGPELVTDVSDHFPVWAEFRISEDDD